MRYVMTRRHFPLGLRAFKVATLASPPKATFSRATRMTPATRLSAPAVAALVALLAVCLVWFGGVVEASTNAATQPPPPPGPSPQDLVAQLTRLLATADANSDGQVTLAEAQAVNAALTKDQFNHLDFNGDGVLTAADLPTGTPPNGQTEDIPTLLRRADTNTDGIVTLAELQAALPNDTAQQIADLFAKLDTNGDGQIDKQDAPTPPQGDPVALLKKLLATADANSDGQVTLAEAQAVVPALTQEQFNHLDSNGDGVLTTADAPSAPSPRHQREDVLRLLREADTNNDGVVTLAELQAALPNDTPEQVADLMARLDTNGDGQLDAQDVPAAPADREELLQQLLEEADVNSDGEVTFAELAAVIPNLTTAQFNHMDRNGDGVLTTADAPDSSSDPLAALVAAVKTADANNDGKVSFAELLAVVPTLTQEQFNALDKNGDGYIDSADRPAPHPDPRVQFRLLLQNADANADGVVTYEEAVVAIPSLTQEQFNEMDRNGDGVLSLSDAPTSLVPVDSKSRIALLQAFVRADTNGDGVLDYTEIAVAFPDAPSELLAELDTNSDGAISRAEIEAALGTTSSGKILIKSSDINADGITSALDIQTAINQALGLASSVLHADINDNGKVDASDVQTVINGALGMP